MLKLIVYSIVILSLAGCAALDINTQETAVPLGKGVMSCSQYVGTALDMHTTVVIDELDQYTYNDDYFPKAIACYTAMRMAYGITNDTDLIIRSWGNDFTDGIKFNVKHLLYDNGSSFYAVIPGFYYCEDDFQYDNQYESQEFEYKNYGAEMQFAYTSILSPSFYGTLVARSNLNLYKQKQKDNSIYNETYGPYLVYNFGLRASLKIKSDFFYLHPEIGFEAVPEVNGYLKAFPVYSLGWGIDF